MVDEQKAYAVWTAMPPGKALSLQDVSCMANVEADVARDALRPLLRNGRVKATIHHPLAVTYTRIEKADWPQDKESK